MSYYLFLGLLIGLPTLGALTRRWSAVLLPVVAWPIYYNGLNREWWGCCGTGDGWQSLAVMFTIFGVVTTAAGVWFGKASARRGDPLP